MTCPTCGSDDPRWDYWVSDRSMHGHSTANPPCPDAYHATRTTQEAAP